MGDMAVLYGVVIVGVVVRCTVLKLHPNKSHPLRVAEHGFERQPFRRDDVAIVHPRLLASAVWFMPVGKGFFHTAQIYQGFPTNLDTQLSNTLQRPFFLQIKGDA